MANNVVLNTGSGGSTIATEQNVTEQYQKIKITDGTGGAFTNMAAVTAGGALKVDASATNQPAVGAAASGASKSGNPVQIGGVFNTTQPTVTTGQAVEVQATTRGALIVATGTDAFTITPSGTQAISAASLPLPSGAATAAKQPALGTAGSASADVITVQGVASMTALKVDGSGVTQPVSGTVTTTPPSNASTNLAQVAGTTTDVNSGAKSAGTLRVVLATDQPALTNKLLVTPDSVALPANQSVNVSQINAVTPLMGNGTTGTGSQRVTIASDNTAFAVNATLQAGSAVVGHVIADSGSTTAVTGTVAVTESGTWTVQPGNTANTTPWLVTPSPATSGGLSMSSTLLAASNNLTSVKGSAGMVYGIQAFGTGSAPYWLKLYNKASAPVVASDSALIVKRILVPANATAANGAGVTVPINDMGLAFSTGIAFACVGLQADADTTNTAAAGAVNIDYK